MNSHYSWEPGSLHAVNAGKFSVERLLGHGKGGYSYLVLDGAGRRCVLKQIHHEPCSYYQFGDKLQSELSDYQILSELGLPLPRLFEVDRERERLLKEYIDGPTVLDLVLADRMQPAYFGQIEAMCAILYAAQLNIDYFPTNFIASKQGLVYIDYECNRYMKKWDFEHWGKNYWSRTPQLEEYLRQR